MAQQELTLSQRHEGRAVKRSPAGSSIRQASGSDAKTQTVQKCGGRALANQTQNQRQEINETDQQWFETNYANPVEAGQYFITKSSVVMQERKASMRRKDTSPRFDADAAVIGLLTQGVQIGPVLDVVVLKASQLFEIEVRVPSRSPEHRSSCVRVCQMRSIMRIEKLLTMMQEQTFSHYGSLPHFGSLLHRCSLLLSKTDAADDGTRRQRRKVCQ